MTYNFIEEYDIIVIGAGHAGVEASLAASRMGCKVLLATINIEMLAFMPCNPSIGCLLYTSYRTRDFSIGRANSRSRSCWKKGIDGAV